MIVVVKQKVDNAASGYTAGHAKKDKGKARPAVETADIETCKVHILLFVPHAVVLALIISKVNAIIAHKTGI